MPRPDNPAISRSIVNYVTAVVLAGRIWERAKAQGALSSADKAEFKIWLNSSLAWGRLVQRHWGW